MKKTNIVLSIAALVAFTALSALAQGNGSGNGNGRGLGVGLGSQVGVHGNAGVNTPPAKVGVETHGSAEARTRVEDRERARRDSNVATHIESNQRLAARLRTMLPAGMSLNQAAAGFKNQGQFIAALHASDNLGIPFSDLKAKMTGEHSMSLGAAIHELRPDMKEHDANEEGKRAEKEAKETEKK